MADDINNTLEQRGSRYGSFESNATITQTLMATAMQGETAHTLKQEHKEALHMIFHKIARMVNGDNMYEDNVHDIIGYAKLLEDWMVKSNAIAKSKDNFHPDTVKIGENHYPTHNEIKDFQPISYPKVDVKC